MQFLGHFLGIRDLRGGGGGGLFCIKCQKLTFGYSIP